MRYGWSVNENVWKEIVGQLGGEGWRNVMYDMSEASSVPDKPGVYVLCSSPLGKRRNISRDPNDLFGVLYVSLYVGKSENLKRRFREHCKQPKKELSELRQCFATSLDFWFKVLPIEKIHSSEDMLIDCLGPQANRIRGFVPVKVGEPRPA